MSSRSGPIFVYKTAYISCIHNSQSSIPDSIALTGSQYYAYLIAMTNEALKSHYLAYIAAIRAHTTDGSWSLEPYVADQVLLNGQQMTRADYETMMVRNTYADVPDLQINVLSVLASETEVAARLQFVGSPVRQFLGWTPKEAGGGERVSFADNCFYRFEGGKIKEIHSIIDPPKPL
ncbi:hypothetical protein CONPUDRAFT_153582 [Coniophora puteana RWD-64-598 SS2]|uniref:SnoaL-like domain-containing protein n=1 Tax=Coniophora puteana (strain RWD-64-598) TaxID=741705 RepID=A0A5M3MPJ0_CONPW|nr:uncharacterized protein CONPUDRAFT_153582 [Coniophora puteana RWD-64-598 SS2]EIW81033.1 hypothetical protein CONPUDRAFT_153582 [Coniophora puteana RWD-64-598 SS2]